MVETLREKLETILVVDDNNIVLLTVVTLLKSADFRVLQAQNAQDALRVASEYSGKIDLLLSDIEMPGMNGPDLGKVLKKARPDVRVMLMSGYADGDLLVLNYGWAFIRKPFVRKRLVEMVNSVLHTPDRSQTSDAFDVRERD
jgi:DNA-binding NtrC family response regulator